MSNNGNHFLYPSELAATLKNRDWWLGLNWESHQVFLDWEVKLMVVVTIIYQLKIRKLSKWLTFFIEKFTKNFYRDWWLSVVMFMDMDIDKELAKLKKFPSFSDDRVRQIVVVSRSIN